jgi:protein-arginine kinase activator protein McsA
MEKGTYVTRSAFQRLAEENKRLLKDIKILCTAPVSEAYALRIDWRKRFQHEAELNAMIRKVALDYGKAHPELRIKAKGYNFCDQCGGAFKSSDVEMKMCPSCY